METASFKLFVYGSLRSGFRTDAYAYLTNFFNFLGLATVQGKLYHNGVVPVATPATGNEVIVGELYELKKASDFNWAFGQLDDYEGLSVEPGEIPPYKREIAMVNFEDTPHTAWIYWFNGSTEGMPELGTDDLLKYFNQ